MNAISVIGRALIPAFTLASDFALRYKVLDGLYQRVWCRWKHRGSRSWTVVSS